VAARGGGDKAPRGARPCPWTDRAKLVWNAPAICSWGKGDWKSAREGAEAVCRTQAAGAAAAQQAGGIEREDESTRGTRGYFVKV
jgi:hypothetical protein